MTKHDDKSTRERNEGDRTGGGGFTPLDQLVSPVGPQMNLPFTSAGSEGQLAENQEQLHVFGESQFHDDLGPVYALPTYPWPHGNNQGMGSSQSIQLNHGHSQNMVHGQWQQGVIQPHPMAFMPCCGCYPVRYRYW